MFQNLVLYRPAPAFRGFCVSEFWRIRKQDISPNFVASEYREGLKTGVVLSNEDLDNLRRQVQAQCLHQLKPLPLNGSDSLEGIIEVLG